MGILVQTRPPDHRSPPRGLPVTVTTDRIVESFGMRRWVTRGARKAMRRLQSILEEDHDRGARATVAGV